MRRFREALEGIRHLPDVGSSVRGSLRVYLRRDDARDDR
jgi:hypothetical protein